MPMEETPKKKKRVGKLLRLILVILLCGVFVFSAYQIYRIYAAYAASDRAQDALLVYKPSVQTAPPQTQTSPPQAQSSSPAASEQVPETEPVTPSADNPTILAMQETYPDACGWITVDDTPIDYCFARGADNSTYLHSSLDGEYLVGGTLFLDYRCAADLSGFQSILFGHNMKNDTMFGILPEFADQAYFDTHTTGTVFLPHATYRLEILAYLVVASTDETIYDPYAEYDGLMAYIQANAKQYREIDVQPEDRLFTLSTCNYTYEGARSVLIGRLVRQ